jgi:hypothetical protein
MLSEVARKDPAYVTETFANNASWRLLGEAWIAYWPEVGDDSNITF